MITRRLAMLLPAAIVLVSIIVLGSCAPAAPSYLPTQRPADPLAGLNAQATINASTAVAQLTQSAEFARAEGTALAAASTRQASDAEIALIREQQAATRQAWQHIQTQAAATALAATAQAQQVYASATAQAAAASTATAAPLYGAQLSAEIEHINNQAALERQHLETERRRSQFWLNDAPVLFTLFAGIATAAWCLYLWARHLRQSEIERSAADLEEELRNRQMQVVETRNGDSYVWVPVDGGEYWIWMPREVLARYYGAEPARKPAPKGFTPIPVSSSAQPPLAPLADQPPAGPWTLPSREILDSSRGPGGATIATQEAISFLQACVRARNNANRSARDDNARPRFEQNQIPRFEHLGMTSELWQRIKANLEYSGLVFSLDRRGTFTVDQYPSLEDLISALEDGSTFVMPSPTPSSG